MSACAWPPSPIWDSRCLTSPLGQQRPSPGRSNSLSPVKVLVFCPNGHVFESRFFQNITNTRHVFVSGCVETCPFDGLAAEIMDGALEVLNGAVRLLAAPQVTLDRLQALERIIRGSADKTPEEVVEQMEAKEPDLIKRLKPLLPKDSNKVATWLLVILTVIDSLINESIYSGNRANHSNSRLFRRLSTFLRQIP